MCKRGASPCTLAAREHSVLHQSAGVQSAGARPSFQGPDRVQSTTNLMVAPRTVSWLRPSIRTIHTSANSTSPTSRMHPTDRSSSLYGRTTMSMSGGTDLLPMQRGVDPSGGSFAQGLTQTRPRSALRPAGHSLSRSGSQNGSGGIFKYSRCVDYYTMNRGAVFNWVRHCDASTRPHHCIG
jgi:hypothetical protein